MVRNHKQKTEDRWSKEDLLEALMSIKQGKMKIKDAAKQYRISKTTLYRQFKKFLMAGGKYDVNQFRTCGGNPILTKVEEDELEKTVRDFGERGFTVTSSKIKRICFEYCDLNGIPNQFNQEKRMAGKDWYYGFLKRHPDVRIGKLGNSSASGDDMNEQGLLLPEVVKTKEKGTGKKSTSLTPSPRKETSMSPSKSPNKRGGSKSPSKRKAPAGSKRGSPKKRRLHTSEKIIIKAESEPADYLMDEEEDPVEEHVGLELMTVEEILGGHDEQSDDEADNEEEVEELDEKIDIVLGHINDYDVDTQEEEEEEEEEEAQEAEEEAQEAEEAVAVSEDDVEMNGEGHEMGGGNLETDGSSKAEEEEEEENEEGGEEDSSEDEEQVKEGQESHDEDEDEGQEVEGQEVHDEDEGQEVEGQEVEGPEVEGQAEEDDEDEEEEVDVEGD